MNCCDKSEGRAENERLRITSVIFMVRCCTAKNPLDPQNLIRSGISAADSFVQAIVPRALFRIVSFQV
jgi:hypothetical protein